MGGTRLLIYGAGGHAREVLNIASDDPRLDPISLIDDLNPGRYVGGLPVITYAEALGLYADASVVVAIGHSSARQMLYRKAKNDGLTPIALLASGIWIAPNAKVGAGSQVFFGTTLSDNVTIGENVVINFHCSISHDVVIEDDVTLSPRVTVAGNVTIEQGVTIGAGATIINGSAERPIRLGANAFVGAGALVLSDVCSGAIVAGVPARTLSRGRLFQSLKRQQ